MDFVNAVVSPVIQIAAKVNTMLSRIHTHRPRYLGVTESHSVLQGLAKRIVTWS
jgi:hypothetical protein